MGLDYYFYPNEIEGPYVVIGKGNTRYDKRFKQFISCMVVLDSEIHLIRLFPIDMKSFSLFKEFEFIRVRVLKKNYEKHRPETQRIISASMSNTRNTFHFTLPFESGEVLHEDNWKKMKRSIALVKPQITKIKQKWNDYSSIKYFCNYKDCKGHINQLDAYTFEQLSALLHEKVKIGFVLGTHSQYPSKWMLISVIPSDDIAERLNTY